MDAITKTAPAQDTSHKIVLPFYIFGALSFLAAVILLILSTGTFTQHYFNPHVLAITHAMALGWGTMIILGASHQLIPVLIEGKLFSNALAFMSFILAATGIPLLVYGFFIFNMGWPSRLGGILINGAILSYLINLAVSISKSKKENVHAVFVLTAACWLQSTTVVGLLLIYNFAYPLFPRDSFSYLPLHAHLGITGWFLLLVIGVGSRLIPLFLISKYINTKLLWATWFFINIGMVTFIGFFLYLPVTFFYIVPVAFVLTGILLFAYYCYQCYRKRIRKYVDEQMKISILAVLMIVLPLIMLIIIIGFTLTTSSDTTLIMTYGFTIFFGCITAIILGMTFKTLPFIVWNKIYHKRSGLGQTPNPKELFSATIFKGMAIAYLAGFILFTAGILLSSLPILKTATIFLLMAAIMYNLNIFKIINHQPARK